MLKSTLDFLLRQRSRRENVMSKYTHTQNLGWWLRNANEKKDNKTMLLLGMNSKNLWAIDAFMHIYLGLLYFLLPIAHSCKWYTFLYVSLITINMMNKQYNKWIDWNNHDVIWFWCIRKSTSFYKSVQVGVAVLRFWITMLPAFHQVFVFDDKFLPIEIEKKYDS